MVSSKHANGPVIVLSANSFWNITNFRTGLVDRLVSGGYRVIVAAPGSNEAWAREHGVEVVDLNMDRSGLNPLRDARLMLDYVRLFQRHRPAFFLGFTAKPNIYGSIAARLTGAASIPNVSGLGTAFIQGGLLGSFLAFLYRIAFRKCPVIMFQNPEDLQLFVSRRIVRAIQAKLLAGSGIDLDKFRPARTPIGPPRFLFVGRLLGDKGVREFVDAARMLKSRHADWKFQLLGDIDRGNRTGIVDEELEGWTREGVIEHLGHADDVRPHVAAASAVVLPSYREGLPRSLLEAAAMAKPLVATDVPGNRQVVLDEENGLLCLVRNSAALAEAMSRVGHLETAELEAMGRKSRLLAEQSFGEDRVIAAYLEALGQQAIGGGGQ